MASPDPTLRGPAAPRPVPLHGPTAASSSLVGATCLAALLNAWVAWYHHGVAVEYAEGVPGVGVAELTSAEATSRTAGVLYLLAVATSAIALLVWLSRVRANARLLDAPSRPARWWLALGGWLAVTLAAAAITLAHPGSATADLASRATADSVVAVAHCLVGGLVVLVVHQTTDRRRTPETP